MGYAFVGMLLAATGAVQAPVAMDEPAPWVAFVGCWESAEAAKGQPMTCILPVAGDPLSADIVMVREGREQRRSRLRADGTVASIAAATCQGTESARFAIDGSRVYLRGDLTCEDAPATGTVAMFAISPETRLIQVSGNADTDRPEVSFRVLDGVPWSRLPALLRDDLDGLQVPVLAERIRLSRIAMSTTAVAETFHAVGAPATEIWMSAMAADAREWMVMDDDARAALAAAGVPTRVATLATAFSDPMRYSIRLSANGAEVQTDAALELQRTMIRLVSATSQSRDFRGGRTGDGVSAASVCGALFGIHAVGGGAFGSVAAVSARGANQMLLNGCGAIFADPRTFQAVYGAYPGAGSDHTERPPRPEEMPRGHPAPDPLPGFGGVGRSAGSAPAAKHPSSSPPPASVPVITAPGNPSPRGAPTSEPGAMRRP